MWFVIIVIVLFIIGKFLYDRETQASKIQKEGGMRNKYKSLLEFLMASDGTKIFEEKVDSITVGVSGSSGAVLFTLTQTFGNVNVQWKIVNNPIFGNHKLEWSFQEYGDQNQMIDRIMNDTMKYQSNVMGRNGF